MKNMSNYSPFLYDLEGILTADGGGGGLTVIRREINGIGCHWRWSRREEDRIKAIGVSFFLVHNYRWYCGTH